VSVRRRLTICRKSVYWKGGKGRREDGVPLDYRWLVSRIKERSFSLLRHLTLDTPETSQPFWRDRLVSRVQAIGLIERI
jgi:hypothetical protein